MKKILLFIICLIFSASSYVFSACSLSKIQNGEVCSLNTNSLTIPSNNASVDNNKFKLNTDSNSSNINSERQFSNQNNRGEKFKSRSPSNTGCGFGVCPPQKPNNRNF